MATLTAPYNYRIISPFSTIVEYLDQQSGTTDPSFNAAMTLAAFGLNAGLDLTALDPLKEAQSGDNAPLLATIKLLDTATILSTLTGYTFQSFAEEIANGTPLNLDAASGIAALIAETGQTYGLTTVQMNEFESIVAAGNAAIDAHAASSNSEADILSYALAAEQLEQSNVAALVNQAFNGLDEAPAGTDAFAAIVTADTGAALDQAITAEESLASQVTSLVPVGPTTTGANAVTFAITFGEAVTGLSAGSFELVTKGGLEGATITGISVVPGSGGRSYDVNVSTGIGLGTVALTYLGGGVGTVAGLPMTNGVIAPAVTYLPVSYISADFDSIAVGDFTGDGRPDAVLAGSGSTDLVTPFVNTGSGAFQAEAPISTQSGADYAESAIITDVNGDGKSDILVADYDPILAGGYGYPSYGGAVTVLLGNGDGGFGQAINTTLDFNPVDMVAGDFTGSGVVDIAMLDYGTNNLHILLGTGTGSFTPVETLITGFNGNNNPVSIVTGDFSNNGKLDLAVSSGNDGIVTIFMGNGDGTFTALAPIAVGDEPVALATGDFNGDGKTDLAVVDRGSNTVTVLLGKGDGTFSTGPSYVFDRSLTGVDDLTSIAVGDLNNDGVADLVVGSASQASVAVLLGNGDGTFRLGSLNMNGIGGAPGLALGDVNGDGRTDILTTGRDVSPYLAGNGGLDVFTNEPETIVGSTSPTVTITRAAVAQPVLTQTSGPGTLTHTGNAYTLNLGTLTQGQAAAVVFALANTAAAPADSFDGLFSTPDGNGFTITGDTLPDAVAAGSAYNGLNFTADTTTSGSHSETITFAPRDATAITAPTATGDGDDASTLPPAAADPDAVALELPPITLTVIDNVQAGTAPTAPAALGISSNSITLANARIGATDRQAVTITNSAASGSASLAVSATATGNATVSGSISGLAPQVSDATTLLAGLNTSAAGARNGSVILTPVSEPDTSLPSQTLQISGKVYRAATASVAGISKIVHVGDAGLVALTVRNIDPADGFSEALDASITSATAGLSFTAGAPVIIAAGASNATSLDIGFSTAAAGTITGTTTLALATDGGTGAGSIDGLGQLALASDPVAVSVTVDNYAQAALSEVSGGGVWVRSGNNYTLNLGTIQQGSSDPMIEIAALNAATGPADALSGSFQLAGSSNFTKTGFGNLSGVAAGASGEVGTVTLNTTNPGTDTETITFNPNGTNASGYTGALSDETLTINAVVQAAPVEPPAVAEINTTLPIAFGNVHLGASATRTLSISNIAQAPAASLDADVSSVSGNAVAGGAIERLAAGSTDASDITAGISTTAAGRRSGDVTLGFLSDNGGTTPLSNQSVAVSGTVYREAAASITPISEIVHVGDPGTASLLVSNTDPDDGYSENLVAMLAGTSGQIGVGTTGPTVEIAANAGDSSLAVSFSTATAGVITGAAKVALTSDGGTGSGSIDGLGKTALSMANVPVTITVDNLAQASFTSQGGTLTKGSTANSWTLDLGSATQGSSPLTASLSVLNAAGGPADLLGGSFTQAATASFSNGGFGIFSGLAANGSTPAGEVSLAAGTAGSYSETITLRPTDTEGVLAATAQAPQTITVIGTITPQTGSAQGDVHMVTFDGLHYDFQATGDFVLARATAPDDTFQIQIRAAEYQQNPGTSVTTEVAAKVGHDTVSFNLNGNSIVSVNGIADTSIAAGRGPQMLDGGELLALSATQFEIEWNTGETLEVTRAGTYFNMSAGLSPQDGPGSVQGLLGGDNGQANDFALPDGTVLAQPLPTSTLLGSFADAWRVAPASSLLNAGSQPSFGSMRFLNSQASNQIGATGTGKILTGSASAQMLGSSIMAIASSNAYRNIPNFKGSNAPSLQLSTAADLPYIGYASQSANILVAGTAPGVSLWRSSIGHGGSLIAQ